MKDVIAANLSRTIDARVVQALLNSYEEMTTEFRKGNVANCLSCSGKFVENVLRAIEHLRTGIVPSEIKSVSATVKEIEKATNLPESISVLVPRVAYAMIFDLRSKRGAVHVKEISPQQIDAALAVQAASWIIAELLRLYHSGNEDQIAQAMAALSRSHIPYVENFGNELVVTRKVPCAVELLLLLAAAAPAGMDRKALGVASKFPSPRVTEALQRLEADRLVHRTKDGAFHLTGSGEQYLTNAVAQGGKPLTVAKR